MNIDDNNDNHNLIIESFSNKSKQQLIIYNSEISKLLRYIKEDVNERLSRYIIFKCKLEYNDYMSLFNSNFKLKKNEKSKLEIDIIINKWNECFNKNDFNFINFANKLEVEYEYYKYQMQYYQEKCIEESYNDLSIANTCYDNYLNSVKFAYQDFIDKSSKYLLRLNKNLPRI